MTNKTQFAMFAVAASVLMIGAVVPAFATNIGSVESTKTAQLNSKVNYSADHDNNVCGTGDVHLESASYVQLSGAGDRVVASYDFSDCSNSISEVYIEISRGSTVLADKTKTNLDSSHQFNFSSGQLNGGDIITITIVGVV